MSRKRTKDEQALMKKLQQDIVQLTDVGMTMLHELEALDPPDPCLKPPEGWRCTRDAGHEGPCAAVEDEAPPTVPSERMASIVPLKREATPGLIGTLQELLKMAEAGEVVGCVFLVNQGNTTRVWYAGHRDFGMELSAFEDYKFRVLVDRNIENQPTFKP